jgi:Ni/Co efflux regulator RcnB
MKRLMSAALALSLLGGAAAQAQPHRDDQRDDHRGPDHHDRGPPEHHWRKGERLPADYRGAHSRYEVADWRAHKLRQPPRGYHWVRDDRTNDYVLAAVATGLIASIIANSN